MHKLTKILYLSFFSLFTLSAKAQMPEVEMADSFRENGKIFVVITIIAIIFLGITAYLIHLDRKISKLEKEQ